MPALLAANLCSLVRPGAPAVPASCRAPRPQRLPAVRAVASAGPDPNDEASHPLQRLVGGILAAQVLLSPLSGPLSQAAEQPGPRAEPQLVEVSQSVVEKVSDGAASLADAARGAGGDLVNKVEEKATQQEAGQAVVDNVSNGAGSLAAAAREAGGDLVNKFQEVAQPEPGQSVVEKVSDGAASLADAARDAGADLLNKVEEEVAELEEELAAVADKEQVAGFASQLGVLEEEISKVEEEETRGSVPADSLDRELTGIEAQLQALKALIAPFFSGLGK